MVSSARHGILGACILQLWCFLLMLSCLMAFPVQAQHDHGGHSAGHSTEYETRMLLASSPNLLRVIWTKTSKDEPIKLVFVEAGAGDACGEEELELAEEGLEEVEEELSEGHMSYHTVNPSGTIAAALQTIQISSPVHNSIATYKLELPSHNCTALFIKHTLGELGLFLLDDATGLPVTPAFEETPESVSYSSSSVAGVAMGGALVVCILPIFILALCSPFAVLKKKTHVHLFFHFMNAFGFGALIAVVTLHLYPEMVTSLDNAGLPVWQGGATVIGGICAVALIHVIADVVTGVKGHAHDPDMGLGKGHSHSHGHSHGHEHNEKSSSEEHRHVEDQVEAGKIKTETADGTNAPESFELVDPATTAEPASHHESIEETTASTVGALRWGTCRDLIDFRSLHPLVWGIMLGDGLHNFVDGTIIATAFLTCGPTAGWTTVAATVAHEVPSELGNFAVMLSKGVTIGQGVFFNLLAQCTALLGCGIVLAIGNEIPESQTSLLLAFGIGTFLFIALTDIMPLVLEVREPMEFFAGFMGMMLAFTAIGLSTLGGDSCGAHSH